jgi:hypothetical protein
MFMNHDNIARYLHQTLGLNAVVKPWAGQSALPYFLQDAYAFARVELLGAPYVLMFAGAQMPSAAKVRKDMDALEQACAEVVVFVATALSSYERTRLIGQKVPFIVPGNQLYLPDLGLDLREYFRQRGLSASKALSPATQAMLIGLLLKPWQHTVPTVQLDQGMGYTSMTVSRAVKELVGAGLATLAGAARTRTLQFEADAHAVWQKALPLLRTPVKQSVWAMPHAPVAQQARLAGESALAQATLLAAPAHPVYAITSAQWVSAQALGMQALPAAEPGACLWQVWSYDPGISPTAGTVDALSLWLSLRSEPDERVQQALAELEKSLP